MKKLVGKQDLEIGSLYALPAEEPGIDGPGAGSHHGQTRSQDR